jgi:hypothetical protein
LLRYWLLGLTILSAVAMHRAEQRRLLRELYARDVLLQLLDSRLSEEREKVDALRRQNRRLKERKQDLTDERKRKPYHRGIARRWEEGALATCDGWTLSVANSV